MICREILSQASEVGKGSWGGFLFLNTKTIMCNSATFDSSSSADLGISNITGEENKAVDLTLLRESGSESQNIRCVYKRYFLGKRLGYSENNWWK